jgi:tetratricopeptide (TPR) repeat protein
MAEDVASPAPLPTASSAAFVATFAVIFIAIAAFLSFDLFLARIDRRESAAHAANEYADGLALLRKHQPADAAEHFATAASIDRANIKYALALGQAKLEEGRLTDAEATLRALLERAENDGAVNLIMARTLRRLGRIDESKVYYHRAVFGGWGSDSVTRRREAQWELIDVLEQQNAQTELLAELLPLEETSPDSVALRQRLGELFVKAGSPARAVSVFRDVLRRDPASADAYADMGDAELALGNFRTARADFAQAARLRPADTAIARRLAVADTVLALDPTARGVGAVERYSRSRAFLARTLEAVAGCGQANTPRADSARAILARDSSGPRHEAAAEAMIELSTDLWSTPCSSGDEVLRLMHDRLSK